jgi:hypothetical protein
MKIFLTGTAAAHVTQVPLDHAPRFSFSGSHALVGPYANAELGEPRTDATRGSHSFLAGRVSGAHFRAAGRRRDGR